MKIDEPGTWHTWHNVVAPDVLGLDSVIRDPRSTPEEPRGRHRMLPNITPVNRGNWEKADHKIQKVKRTDHANLAVVNSCLYRVVHTLRPNHSRLSYKLRYKTKKNTEMTTPQN